MWDAIRELVAEGTAVLLTTQYLDEADQLADEIAVLDLGRVIAYGTPEELKRRAGGQVLEIRLSEAADIGVVAAEVATLAGCSPSIDRTTKLVAIAVEDTALVAAAIRRFDEVGIMITDLALRRPSLDEVFLQLTGHKAETNDPAANAA